MIHPVNEYQTPGRCPARIVLPRDQTAADRRLATDKWIASGPPHKRRCALHRDPGQPRR